MCLNSLRRLEIKIILKGKGKQLYYYYYFIIIIFVKP